MQMWPSAPSRQKFHVYMENLEKDLLLAHRNGWQKCIIYNSLLFWTILTSDDLVIECLRYWLITCPSHDSCDTITGACIFTEVFLEVCFKDSIFFFYCYENDSDHPRRTNVLFCPFIMLVITFPGTKLKGFIYKKRWVENSYFFFNSVESVTSGDIYLPFHDAKIN